MTGGPPGTPDAGGDGARHPALPVPGPAFHLTHAWVWANNPAGMFADWNPELSC